MLNRSVCTKVVTLYCIPEWHKLKEPDCKDLKNSTGGFNF